MKSLKLIIINALTLLIGLGLLTGSLSQRNANAARFEVIPALQIAKLGQFRGQYLTILYAVGSRPLISSDSDEINISQVKESRTIYITDDTMNTPIVQVEKEGFRPSYNIVAFVISSQPNYSWVNNDSTIPQGVTSTNNHQSALINTINRTSIDTFVNKNGDTATLTVNLQK